MENVKALPDEAPFNNLVTSMGNGAKGNAEESLSSTDFSTVSAYVGSRISLYEKVMELQPDLELLGSILVSSIISPKDAVKTRVNIHNDSSRITDGTKYLINNYIEKELASYYKIQSTLYSDMFSMYVTDGAKCKLVISKKSIDTYIERMFNKGAETIKKEDLTLESLMKSINIQATPISTSSDVGINDLIECTYDSSILGISGVMDYFSAENIKDKIATDKEKLVNDMFKDLDIIGKNVFTTIDDSGVGGLERPLIMNLPMEAVIPIIDKGNPSEHLDYIVLLDGNGVPISIRDTITPEVKEDLSEMKIRSSTSAISIANKNKNINSISSAAVPTIEVDRETLDLLIDDKIKEMYKNKRHLALLDNTISTDISKIMFKRVLRQQKTTMLYVKKENLIYFADEYRSNGVGKSILDKLLYTTSMRSLLETAATVADIKSNIPRKDYTITLDDEDQDPDATSKEALSYILQGERNILPGNLFMPQDLSRWATGLGITAKFKSPKLPNVEVELDERTSNNSTIDDTVLKRYDDKISMGFGLSPEVLENGRRPDFAISEIFKNSLTASRMLRKQEKLELMLGTYVKAILSTDGIMKTSIINIFDKEIRVYRKMLKKQGLSKYNKENLTDLDIAEVLFADYISNVRVSLPKPENITDSKIKDDYEDFISVAEDYLERRVDTESLSDEITGEFGEKAESLIPAILGVLSTRWMRRNNYYPEITELFTDTPDRSGFDDNLFVEHESFIKNLEVSILSYIKNTKKITTKNSKKLSKILDSDGEELDDDDYGDEKEQG